MYLIIIYISLYTNERILYKILYYFNLLIIIKDINELNTKLLVIVLLVQYRYHKTNRYYD
jgi:hypothetical protein